jgi:hypothetical protein
MDKVFKWYAQGRSLYEGHEISKQWGCPYFHMFHTQYFSTGLNVIRYLH